MLLSSWPTLMNMPWSWTIVRSIRLAFLAWTSLTRSAAHVAPNRRLKKKNPR
jgi:hypothetical protein